jgi:hypothetical protein
MKHRLLRGLGGIYIFLVLCTGLSFNPIGIGLCVILLLPFAISWIICGKGWEEFLEYVFNEKIGE